MEGFLNSLISLMFSMTEKRDDVICTFVKCLVDMENHPALRHRVYVMEIYQFLLNELKYFVQCKKIVIGKRVFKLIMFIYFRLSVLFCGLNPLDPTRYNVYCGQLELASKSGLLDMVVTDLEQVSFISFFNLICCLNIPYICLP